MKNKWSLLWNPFTRIAGWQALGIGLIVMALTGVIGKCGALAFDGVLDAHLVSVLSFQNAFLLLAIDWLSLVVVMAITGFVIARDVRFVDIAGTMTLARAPFLLMALFSLGVSMPDASTLKANPAVLLAHPTVIIFSVLSIPVLVWFVALMYNGLKVSTGGKGAKLITGFMVGLIIAEILSKTLIHFFL